MLYLNLTPFPLFPTIWQTKTAQSETTRTTKKLLEGEPTVHTMSLHNIPTINLLCMETKYISAFNEALRSHWRAFHDSDSDSESNGRARKFQINMIDTSLRNVPTTTKFDLIVSPANSYGLLDGAFDDAISRVFCANRDLPYATLTYAVQDVLYEKYRGFAPPGTCTLVRFPDTMLASASASATASGGKAGDGDGDGKTVGDNPWGCRWIAICPTMRIPGNATWNREIVYECVWSLLCEVEGWNRRQGHSSADRIESILMTPLATGVGKVSPERWAAQLVLALKHFVDAVERPERWARLTWMDLGDEALEVERTV